MVHGPSLDMIERTVVRVFVAMALCLSLLSCALVPTPSDAAGNPDLPAPAFGQPGLYRLEIALLIFYGSLLLITPVFSGLIRGRLPIEIPTRGAKFAKEADQSAEAVKTTIKKLEQTTKSLIEDVSAANLEIERLKEAHGETEHNRR